MEQRFGGGNDDYRYRTVPYPASPPPPPPSHWPTFASTRNYRPDWATEFRRVEKQASLPVGLGGGGVEGMIFLVRRGEDSAGEK
ncbi:hypothetical protein BaRGS_00017540 [Batillaria attramentaria]|uniref:Uncharacterized protein n=1 Tax=Batillaria attramentaria TaxID=370345 RepID=A0ABD0KVV6_9CAEN